MHACSAHFILLDGITLIISDDALLFVFVLLSPSYIQNSNIQIHIKSVSSTMFIIKLGAQNLRKTLLQKYF